VLRRLPDGQRACVVLRHYADLSLEQAAQALGISTGAVKSQTSRGLARLRADIDQMSMVRRTVTVSLNPRCSHSG
jgi:RNA polymerase sigma factor (sigma-70 family)